MQDFVVKGLLDDKKRIVEFIPLSRKAKDWCASNSMKGCVCFHMEKPEAFMKFVDLIIISYTFQIGD